jgi:uncharacterized protein
MAREFVGAGWAFPLRTDATGGVALVRDDREVAESIRLILGTAPGERPMRPEFGCGVHDHVFDPADSTTAGWLAYEVRRALDRWEPRITVHDVDVVLDPADTSAMYITISYSISGTYDPRSLVFPFYVIPDHEPATAGG